MASLFEINAQLRELWEGMFDPETGEVNSEVYAATNALEMDRTAKIESIGCWIKNLRSDAEALKAEADNMAKRAAAAEKRAESLSGYLAAVLAGEKFQTPKVAISWRRSQAVEVLDQNRLPDRFLKETVTVKPDKIALKEALKNGEYIEGAELIERRSISIK